MDDIERGGKSWGDPITNARKDELEALESRWFRENTGSRLKGPFAGVKLTGADVFWLSAHALTAPGEDHAKSEMRLLSTTTPPSIPEPIMPPVSVYDVFYTSIPIPNLHLEGADLTGAQLEHAMLSEAHLEGAHLEHAHMKYAVLEAAHLEGAFLKWADLEKARLVAARLNHAALTQANLRYAWLMSAQLIGCDATKACFEGADLSNSNLQAARLFEARMENSSAHIAMNAANVKLRGAQLQHTWFAHSHFERADLSQAHLEGAVLDYAYLNGTNLSRASFNSTSQLGGTRLSGANFDRVIFDGTSLTSIDWAEVIRFGEELRAREGRWTRVWYDAEGNRSEAFGDHKPTAKRIEEYLVAARTYRSIGALLKTQGLNGFPSQFNARAELMECSAFLLLAREIRLPNQAWQAVKAYSHWLRSLCLYWLAGLSARIGSLVLAYAITIVAFTVVYLLAGQQANTGLTVQDALILSVTSFHGRGLQPASHLTDSMRMFSGLEAMIGLLLEVLLVAAFTRRVTGN